MKVEDVRGELPGWDVRRSKGGNWQAYSPTIDLDGVCIIARTSGDLIGRVRTHVQIVAMAARAEAQGRPAATPEHPKASVPVSRPVDPVQSREDAKTMGFEGDACGDCGAMRMVRNGSCLKCTACGSTNGCS